MYICSILLNDLSMFVDSIKVKNIKEKFDNATINAKHEKLHFY